MNVLDKPIFIVGAPRSGTTVLAEILRAHPDLAYVREPRLVWRYGNDHKSDMLTNRDARPEVRHHIRSFFAKAVHDQGGRRLLEKTPSNSLRPSFIDAVFPDCRFVHIVRDGPDCVTGIRRAWTQQRIHLGAREHRERLGRRLHEAGWRRAHRYAFEMVLRVAPQDLTRRPRPWGPRLPGLDGLTRDLDLLAVSSLQWRFCVETMAYYGRRLPRDRYVECQLEALTIETIREILAFADLGDAPDVTTAFQRIYNRASIVPQASTLAREERERVAAWIEPTMTWLHTDTSVFLSGQWTDGGAGEMSRRSLNS